MQNLIVSQWWSLPTHCLLCQTCQRSSYPVCQACMDDLPRLMSPCRTCAIPLDGLGIAQCTPCITHPPFIDRVLTAYSFNDALRFILHQFKYQEGLYLTAFIAHLMQQARPIHYPTQCLIPVPMHPNKIRLRGYNQALLLAKKLGRQLNIPVDSASCVKVIDTPHQAGLTARMRAKNLAHAFRSKTLHLQHVTLIDDLITTGATANELAKTLKHAGIKRVDLWCGAKVCLS